MLHVYTNSNSCQLHEDAMTIEDFEKFVLNTHKKEWIDQHKQMVILKYAVDLVPEDERFLFNDDLQQFLENGIFLLKFFRELTVEEVSFDLLKEADSTYKTYNQEITFLEKVYHNYIKLMNDNQYVDHLMLYYSDSTIRTDYLSKLQGGIVIHYEGFISRFDLHLFKEISKIIPLYLEYNFLEENQKILKRLNEYVVFESKEQMVKSYGRYLINFSTQKIENFEPVVKKRDNVFAIETPLDIMQAGYIYKEALEKRKEGKPLKVLILCESIIKHLFEIDRDNLFFRRSRPFGSLSYMKRIKSLLYLIDNIPFKADMTLSVAPKKKEHQLRYERITFEEYFSLDTLNFIWQNWNNEINFDNFKNIVKELVVKENEACKEKLNEFLEEFCEIEKIANKLTYHYTFMLFYSLLAAETIPTDDVGEIEIVTMLDSREMEYENLIIAGFNRTIFPIKSIKDLFLNTETRRYANLPTIIDRVNMQNYYMKLLMNRVSGEAHILGTVNNNESFSVSIKEFSTEKRDVDFKEISKCIFSNPVEDLIYQKTKDIVLPKPIKVNKKKKLSASQLKTYLQCKKKYYLDYLAHAREHELPKDEPDGRDIGDVVHKVLFSVYNSKESSLDDVLGIIPKEMSRLGNNNGLEKFHSEIWTQKVKEFVRKDFERVSKENRKIFKLEYEISGDVFGVPSMGILDRIEVEDDNILHVQDYKTGKIKIDTGRTLASTIDFQLEFYKKLCEKEFPGYKIGSLSYYDVNEAKILTVPMEIIDAKLGILEEILTDYKKERTTFEMTERSTDCTFCPFYNICH